MSHDDLLIITAADGEPFEIPVEGSLGLLALGDIGLWAWRRKIDEVKREIGARSQQQTEPNSKPDGAATE